ncbi:hypothetical protein BDY21DRAFT_372815 [Lineolata rhizophorae]|uniref:Protein kinase domain-containing protein n=1 Tax=Lineolata rhizophorae TaxID=578093 RepID=A0A6A6NXG4_9PEZI|nr:hypothetical protein BDY21DRAFT_372815 [Lineolata rhizophorae]
MSMTNLHEEPGWGHWTRSPPSPTTSSISSASRSVTPTNNNSTNPWATSSSSAPNTPPKDGSPKSLTPPSTSRSTTPVAPRPVKPIYALPFGFSTDNIGSTPERALLSSRPSFASATPTPLTVSIDLPMSPAHNPFRELREPQAVNRIVTPAEISQFQLELPKVLQRQHWDSHKAQRAYQWAVVNPRTALLLCMCNELSLCPRAQLYGLGDRGLPYDARDFAGIFSDPQRAAAMQWMVVSKELPQNGQHVEFSTREIVPLDVIESAKLTHSDFTKVEKVRWKGDVGEDGRVFVRKTLAYSQQPQKITTLAQIQEFKKLEHPHISRIICSYSRGNMVAYITPVAQCSLADYLMRQPSPSRSRLLLDWIADLTQAVAFLHSRDVQHRSIRPSKILIERGKVMLAPFGIAPSTDSGSPRSTATNLVPPYASPPSSSISPSSASSSPSSSSPSPLLTSGEAYIFASPELIARRKYGRSGDVFSLGCVFLTMLSAAKGCPSQNFARYRAGASGVGGDASFHANLECVAAWMTQLRRAPSPLTAAAAAANNGGAGAGAGSGAGEIGAGLNPHHQHHHRRGDAGAAAATRALAEENRALDFVEDMLRYMPGERVKMRRLAPVVDEWRKMRAGGSLRRRSFDNGVPLGMRGAAGGGGGAVAGAGGGAGAVGVVGHTMMNRGATVGGVTYGGAGVGGGLGRGGAADAQLRWADLGLLDGYYSSR